MSKVDVIVFATNSRVSFRNTFRKSISLKGSSCKLETMSIFHCILEQIIHKFRVLFSCIFAQIDPRLERWRNWFYATQSVVSGSKASSVSIVELFQLLKKLNMVVSACLMAAFDDQLNLQARFDFRIFLWCDDNFFSSNTRPAHSARPFQKCNTRTQTWETQKCHTFLRPFVK